MSTKRSRKRKSKAEPIAQQLPFYDVLFGSKGQKMITLSAVVGATAYILGVFTPVWQSGPLPVPSRAEVEKLREETSMNLDGLKKGIDATLEVAKAAQSTAEGAAQQSSDNRVRRLVQQKIDLENALKQSPGDRLFQQQLVQLNIELAQALQLSQQQQGISAAASIGIGVPTVPGGK